MSFKNRCNNPFQIITDGAVEQIHETTLRLLDEVGIRFSDGDALRFLESHGCRVDFDQQVVRFSPDMVQRCLDQCPPQFTLRARNSEYNLVFDPSTVHFSAGSGMQVLDVPTMQRRPGTSQDAAQAVRLCQVLENIAGANTGLGWLADKPEINNLEWLYAIALRNSEKVTSVGVMDDSEKWGIRMAQAVGADIIVTVNSASPLGWSADQIEGMRRAIAAGLPAVGLQSMASPGMTAPVTLAGTAVVMNAEILAMTALIQLLKPGTGIMYSCFTIPLDMKTTMLASGSIELGMLLALSARLSQFYGMGSIIYAPMSDAKLPDQQAGYEKAMQWLLGGMAGINLLWGAGMVEGHTLWSNAQLVIDAEMAGMVGRALEGIPLSAETLAFDVIAEVGHFPHSYIATDHTYEWWRSVRYLPLVASREAFEHWEDAGSQDVLARADAKAKALLESYEPVPLSPEVDREIDALLDAAAREKRART